MQLLLVVVVLLAAGVIGYAFGFGKGYDHKEAELREAASRAKWRALAEIETSIAAVRDAGRTHTLRLVLDREVQGDPS